MDKNILSIITEHFLNGRMDSIILYNPEYLGIMGTINQLEEKLSECGITDDTKHLVGELESEYLTLNSFYAKTAYLQGFRDCASLLAETGLLKQPNDYKNRIGKD